jgi:Concanavalin A-like lectin/glucanases superfamily
LIVHLPFNNNLNDASGKNNNATGVNGINFSMNRYFEDNKAVSLNGTSNWIEIPEQKIVGLQKFSFYIEFMPTSSAPQCLMGKRTYNPATTSPLSQAFNFLINYSGAPVRFSLRKAGQCNNDLLSSFHTPLTSGSEQLMINCWNNVVGTYDGTVQKLYLNGKLVGQQNISGVEMCSGDPVRLGIWWKDDPLFFSGKIDEVRIYDRAITSQEVTDLYKLSN